MDRNIAAPRLSVVMPVFNDEDYVAEAVQSVLNQDLTDFELIIINDGSTDGTAAVLERFNDSRIRLYVQVNQGLVASLNRAVSLAQAPLIARHDADDRSLQDRFAKQIELFDRESDIVLAGSSIQVMDTAGTYRHDHMVLLQDAELKQELLVRSPFAHGSVMFKKEAFDKAGGYRQSEWPAEDYGLWLRMARFGTFANIDTPLYRYRENDSGISATYAYEQAKQAILVARHAWRQRARLLSTTIHVAPYLNLYMGQQRINRIASNLLVGTNTALRKGDLLTASRLVWPIITSRHLLRKCARIILTTARITHD